MGVATAEATRNDYLREQLLGLRNGNRLENLLKDIKLNIFDKTNHQPGAVSVNLYMTSINDLVPNTRD